MRCQDAAKSVAPVATRPASPTSRPLVQVEPATATPGRGVPWPFMPDRGSVRLVAVAALRRGWFLLGPPPFDFGGDGPAKDSFRGVPPAA